MAGRKPLIQTANDMSAMVLMEARAAGMPERVERMHVANLVLSEFAEMAQQVERSLRDHGEVTPRTYRYLRENVRDLAVNVLGRTDVPSDGAATPCVAD